MKIAVEISLLPLTSDFKPPVRDFIARLREQPGLEVQSNTISTQIFGEYDLVFEILKREMRKNLEGSHGLYFSQGLLLALVDSGLSRDDAYRIVQGHAMRAWEEELDFPGLVRADAGITQRLDQATLDSIFDLDHYTRHVDTVFDRLHALTQKEEAVHA